MLKLVKWSVWGSVLLGLFAACLRAQNFVYTNNDTYNGPNSISAYSVDNASLCASVSDVPPCQIAGSPFLTGGLGTSSTALPPYAANRIIVVGNFLYTSNAGSNTVSAFAINSGTGVITQIGSPMATNGSDDPSNSGISLAATPDGTFLYAGTTDGTITVFSINDTTKPPVGGLTKLGSVSADGPMYSMKVSTNGSFLILSVNSLCSNCTNPYGLDVFDIRTDKTLQSATKTLFSVSPDAVTSIDIDCASTLLFAGRASIADIDVFNFDSNGQLLELTNSPFSTSSGSYQGVVLSTDDKTLFSSNPGAHTVTAFPVLSGMTGIPDGSLDVSNATPASAAGTSGLTVFSGPAGLAVSQDGAFLYAADTSVTGAVGAISAFGLTGSMPLTFNSLTHPIPSPYPTGQFSKLQSLAAYPAKACAPPPPSNSLAVNSLQVTGGPPPAFELDAILSLDSSLGVNPFLTQAVTIQIGEFELPLPPGSFKTFQEGRNAETDLYQGVVESTTLKVQITPLGPNESGQNQFQIHVLDKQVDLVGLDNPVTVTVKVGAEDDSPSASAPVMPTFPTSLRGNWRDQ